MNAGAGLFRKPLRVYAKARDGRWHRTTATYPSDADTLCGLNIPASTFATHPQEVDIRPEYCDKCQPPPPHLTRPKYTPGDLVIAKANSADAWFEKVTNDDALASDRAFRVGVCAFGQAEMIPLAPGTLDDSGGRRMAAFNPMEPEI